ncbi:MAG: hypothetical protein COB76_02340 [Alphaproteobacteria bacterium]|nr:MAG: hypothetical protein COB76_02340 [Alphaproteobacteria bacterium]
MDYSFLSLEALPFILPILVCAIIFTAAQYGHLNFKHLRIQKVSMIAALIVVPISIFFVPLIIKMAFTYSIPILKIHTLFIVLSFLCVLCISVVTAKAPPKIIQLLGLCLFGYGAYSFLA